MAVQGTAKKPKRTNPNGANQYKVDPRQALCLAYYLDPKSPTFGNMTRSGVKAGFEEIYAKNLMNLAPEWLSQKLDAGKYHRMLEKAEGNLEEMLGLPSKVQAMGAFGPLYETIKTKTKTSKGKTKIVKVRKPIMTFSSGLLKIKNDTSKFVAERIGRKQYGPDVPQGNQTLILMVTGESAKRYGLTPHGDPEHGSE